ncbi:hypothetical protein KAR26_02570 [Candidatus Parcubacteria bacterium]|nr:hypothetical protein [Candidatus Parcubacteria bacterium]
MPINQILFPLFFSLFFSHIAFVLGFFILGKIRAREDSFLFNTSCSILLGYGFLGYIALFFSYLGALNKLSIFVFSFLILLLGYKYLIYFYKNLKKVLRSALTQTRLDKILLSFLLILIVLVSFSAFMPPFRTDTIFYHLPEARMMAENRVFTDDWNKLAENLWTPWTASIPLLTESLFAIAITVSDFSLAHLTHYQIFLSLILFIYVFIRKRFNKTYGLLAALSIFTLFELVVNSTVTYVDAAMVAFDIAGLLIFISWFFSNKKSSLILSALLLGFAASIKYLSFYNLAIIILFFLFKIIFIDKKNIFGIIKISLLFFGFWLMSAGFWYIKNLILYLNPVYPFLSSVPIQFKDVYSRNITEFFAIPFKVFMEPHYFSVFLGFFALPFLFLFRKIKSIQENQKIITLLSVYFPIFLAIWFFGGAHVRRYTVDGQVVLMILVSIILGAIITKLRERIKLVWLIMSAVLILIPTVFFVARQENNFLIETVKLQKEYILGEKNKYDFYRFQNLGEEFFISDYVNKNLENEKIINNLCPKEGNFFIEKNNLFLPFMKSTNFISKTDLIIEEDEDVWPQVVVYLEKHDINYLMYAWQKKEENYARRSGSCTPLWEQYKERLLPVENLIIEHSDLVFSDNGTELYKITF